MTYHTQICVGGRTKYDNKAMQKCVSFFSSTGGSKTLAEKLNISGITLPDPYGIDQGFGQKICM